MPVPSRWQLVLAAATTAIGAVSIAIWLRRRRRNLLPGGRTVIGRYKSRVESADRPWYKEIVVTEERVDSVTVIRSLHLGSEDTVPESRVTMRNGEAIVDLRHKQHLQYTLLAFAWLGRGFEANDEGEPARAALIGVAGGSLLHFWRERVPGGSELLVDAVELDGAVLDAARDHLGLSACETPPNGKCTFHVGDGAAFLREAEDEAYDLLVVDLDMGALVSKAEHKKKHDPARDMYRVLSSRGVLVVNEFSEEPVAERLESSLRLVRQLRRFFPEVHQIRTTTHHNVMVVAAVDRKGGTDAAGLALKASRIQFGDVDLGNLMATLPANRHQVYAHDK